MGTTVGHVSEIWRYPVKSMGGERLESTDLDANGIPGDRRFAVRDSTSGKVISAKQPRPGARLLDCRASTVDGALEVTVDGATFTLEPADELDRALSALLGRQVHLDSAAAAGDVYESYWPQLDGDMALNDVTADLPVAMGSGRSFVDLAALHVIATASIDHLARVLPDTKVTAARFRPGILVRSAGAGEFVENDWAGYSLRVGAAVLTITAAAPRCIMTTLAQPGLARDAGVLRTIARLNRRDFGGFGDFACLGAYAEVAEGGSIAVGDEVVLG
jgi:uncharacterized protein